MSEVSRSVMSTITAFLQGVFVFFCDKNTWLHILAFPAALWLAIYVSSNIYMKMMGPVDLKKKYNAQWALVTGAGSGIGKALCFDLAKQGLNVVLVSLPFDIEATTKEIKAAFPHLQFRAISAVFDHKTDYMPAIIEGTKDITVQVIYNNAGYMVSGFFDTSSLDKQLANLECNATACVKVTHHFLREMLDKKVKGAIIFTSSVSAYIPNPFAVMYGSTKAFVSQFAACLAPEVRPHGIDVLAMHPSPVASNFFNKTHKLDGLEFAKQVAVGPDSIPPLMNSCIGRAHLADMGTMALMMRVVMAIVPYDFFASIFSYWAPYMGDYKKYNFNRGKTEKAN